MVNNTLVWFLEKNNILPYQSGFSKHKSTLDAFSQLTYYIEKAFQKKNKHTRAVFFDLCGEQKFLNSLYAVGLGNVVVLFIGVVSGWTPFTILQ